MINIVTEPPSVKWAMSNYCDALEKRLPIVRSEEFNPRAEVNIFLPYYYYDLYSHLSRLTTPTVGFFTHLEKMSQDTFNRAAAGVDWCVAMCEKTASYLPKDKTTIIQVYPGDHFRRESIIVGVVGKESPSGRKRFELVTSLNNPHITVRFASGQYTYEQMPSFYDEIDYLVVTSNNEGGPMPVVEALSRGKPVIAPDVGFSWKFPVIRYTTEGELMDILSNLYIDPVMGWNRAADELAAVIKKAQLKYASLT